MIDKQIRKSIIHHFRRTGINEPDEKEWRVFLEKDGKTVQVGQYCCIEGSETITKPKDVFELIEKGWKVLAIYSCYRWIWTSRRYNGGYGGSDGEDWYGRSYIEVAYQGYYEKVDIVKKDGSLKRESAKWFEGITFEVDGKTYWDTIPDFIKNLMDVDWMEKDETFVSGWKF